MRLATSLVLVATFVAPAIAREFVATEKSFECLTKGVAVPGKLFYVFGKTKDLRKRAVRKATTGRLGKGFPKGTILQLFPFEAMAKRGGRFNPEGEGWEYFRLGVTPDGQTQILARGGIEVANALGSCQGCHLRLAADHDSVCEFVIGAAGLGLTTEQVRAEQASDPRCK